MEKFLGTSIKIPCFKSKKKRRKKLKVKKNENLMLDFCNFTQNDKYIREKKSHKIKLFLNKKLPYVK